MTVTNHYFIMKVLTTIILVIFCAVFFMLFNAWHSLPENKTVNIGAENTGAPEWNNSNIPSDINWNVFRSKNKTTTSHPAKGTLAARFRLAGTFFVYGGVNGKNSRKAILDDLKLSTQHIVSEDDQIGHVKVLQVFRNRIVLRDNTHQEELWMSFSGHDSNTENNKKQNTEMAENEALKNAKFNRYGIKKIGHNRWLLNRDKLMEYYQELMDNPERLVAVFDSLKPLYNEDSKITGYQLGVEGESDFFNAVGFKEGDVVRSVNSIPMTNRRRAEYFIKEFVNDRSNAFVLKLERNGQEQRFIYQVR